MSCHKFESSVSLDVGNHPVIRFKVQTLSVVEEEIKYILKSIRNYVDSSVRTYNRNQTVKAGNKDQVVKQAAQALGTVTAENIPYLALGGVFLASKNARLSRRIFESVQHVLPQVILRSDHSTPSPSEVPLDQDLFTRLH